MNNPYNVIDSTKKEGQISLTTSKEKFHTINTNNNEINKSYKHINLPSFKNSASNLNNDHNYNPIKTNESETSGRSSPQTKTNSKNNSYQAKLNSTEVNKRIITEGDYSSNAIIKNKIPLSNKNNRSEPFKVFIL